MFFLNLSLGEFLSALGILSGVITALYLLDRAKKRRVVSSLRFWVTAPSADERHSRRRMRDPWSLLLQLASLALLLLAIAQLQWGKREQQGRDNVLLLDTSSWTAQRNGGSTILDREKDLAQRYIGALRPSDRVMLVRVDALATPITAFTADRSELNKSLAESNSSFSSLNVSQALTFAGQAQSWSGHRDGEIVYVGPRLVDETGALTNSLPNLRIIPVAASEENCGIRRIGIKRGEDANAWQASITIKNYGSKPRALHLETSFAGTRFVPRPIMLDPGQERVTEYNFVTNSGGRFTARITPGDSLTSDDRCEIELPRIGLLKLAVFTRRPEVWRALLDANRTVESEFFPPESFAKLRTGSADVVLIDSFSPSEAPRVPVLWLNPPRERAPLPVKTVVSDAILSAWRSEISLGEGLHARGDRLPQAEVFQTFEGDIDVGSVAEGPVVVARDAKGGQPKESVIGFDPFSGQLRFEVTTPLLFANLFRWLAPESFRTHEVDAGRVGSTAVVLDSDELSNRISAREDGGASVPFTARNGMLEIFEGRPSIVRVSSNDRQRILSLTLPDIGSAVWNPERPAATGLPSRTRFFASSVDLWQWLAALGAIGLIAEWLLFGQRRRIRTGTAVSGRSQARRPAPVENERELVSR